MLKTDNNYPVKMPYRNANTDLLYLYCYGVGLVQHNTPGGVLC